MNNRSATYSSMLLLFGAWLALLVTALIIRPLLPVDETRYVSVAWEMWTRGDFLVPYLNGETYSHKPPLLFWLIHAGWWLFGVNDWWPRLVAPLISLANMVLVALLARRLWPQQPAIAALAPWLLFGSLFWLFFYTLVQFDLLLVFCTLLGMLGMLRAARGLGTGWLIVGLAIGLGVLSKGPVILLHLLPAALLGGLWVDRTQLKGWVCWYGGMMSAVLLGAVIGLAWAFAAGQAGGEEYRHAIFWGQTAERVVDSFAHKEPVWWYLPWLPVLLLPWSIWPTFWRALRKLGDTRQLRFLLCWSVPVLLVLSLVSGKQIKYLLPIVPAIILMISYGLGRLPERGLPQRPWTAVFISLFSALLLVLAASGHLGHQQSWVKQIQPLWALGFVAMAFAVWLWQPRSTAGVVRSLAIICVLVVIGLHLTVLRVAAPAYDLTAFSQRLAELQVAHHPIANVNKYHGQFQFLGRLHTPIAQIAMQEATAWARAHPDGYLIVYHNDWPDMSREGADLVQDFRGDPGDLALWPAAKWIAAQ